MSGRHGGRAGGTARASDSTKNSDEIVSRVDPKWRRILRLLAEGQKLNRFDAERFGDHALNSTIAKIGRMGVRVSREPITLTGRFGTIHCKRYWIEPNDVERAFAILRARV